MRPWRFDQCGRPRFACDATLPQAAGSLLVAEEVVTEERPDASHRADLADALRVARAALADAVEAEDDAAEAAARAQVRALRDELDALPADTATRRERVWSSET
jgi:hypothetical protein